MITIETIADGSPHLAAVMALHRSESKHLGMFPKGAFQERAEKKQILLALSDVGECIGYLLYRTARDKVSITHLCVRSDFRGKGVARALVTRLKSTTKHLRGIGLHCRRDYEINDAWQKFGFVAVASKRGRGTDGAVLDYWWLDNNHADLFSLGVNAQEAGARLRVVIDANIFYDLHERNTPESEDSKALLADWLQESIELCVTPEMHNEIRRAPFEAQWQKGRRLVESHRMLKNDDDRVQVLIGELAKYFPTKSCQRDDSDLRQIAHSVAADIPFFVTRDQKLIERCDALLGRFGLRVLHPTDLINELDSLRRESEYRPVRLEGSRLTTNLLRVDQVEMAVEAFIDSRRERRGDFEKNIRHFLAKPTEYQCTIALADNGLPLAFLVKSNVTNDAATIEFLRLSDHSLAPTVARHILRRLMEQASVSRILIRITDPYPSEELKIALGDLGFVSSPSGWWKVCINNSVAASELKLTLGGLICPSEMHTSIIAGLDVYLQEPTAQKADQIEKVLWPLKIADSDISSFLVPIQAQWAEHFFDSDLGSQLLFGLKDHLHLGIEGAYYCSKRNTLLQQPGRVLWYVSKGPERRGSMTIKACSRIEEIFVGKPKEVFKKFNRLGVYHWRDVLNASKGNINEELLGFRFSMTERFLTPVSFEMIKHLGVNPPLMSPRKLTAEQFSGIYNLGKELHH